MMEKLLVNPRGICFLVLSFFFVFIISCSIFLSEGTVNTVSLVKDNLIEKITPVQQQQPIIVEEPKEITYHDAIRTLYRPMLHSITDETFVDSTDGTVYYTNRTEPWWTQGLGKEICIVDVDTRGLDDPKQLFNEDFNWADLDGVSTGMLNHYQYAAIHGYDYKFIHSTKWPNNARDDVWTKPPVLRDILADYRIVIMIDADAIFRHLELPLEWLLNRWNFTQATSIAMPWDVDVGYTNNKWGDLNPNAGVVVAQNNPRTFEMLDTWIACPDREEFEDCKRFHHGWPAEQGAFGEYVRYEYKEEEDFKGFYCNDANGFPNQGTDCAGMFIRHFTTGKDQLKVGTGDALLQTLMARTQVEMLKSENNVRLRKSAKDLVEKEFWKPMVEEEEKKDEGEGEEHKDEEEKKEDVGEEKKLEDAPAWNVIGEEKSEESESSGDGEGENKEGEEGS